MATPIAFQALMVTITRPGRVIYVSTAGESLAPALRLGWLVVPEDLVEAVAGSMVVRSRRAADLVQFTRADFV